MFGTINHEDVAAGNQHLIYRWAQSAEPTVAADDVGKIWWDTDDDVFRLALTTDPTWAVIASTEGQIPFPATQVPSSDANTLDDYQEGTYNATLVGADSGSFTLSLSELAYIKIGKLVHVQGEIAISGKNSPVGGLRLSIPFESANFGSTAQNGIGSCRIGSHGGTIDLPFIQTLQASFYVGIYKETTGGATSVVDSSDVDTAFYIWVGFTYIAGA